MTVLGWKLGKIERVPALFSSRRRGELMGMAAPLYYSAQMVRAIPDDGKRYETVHGELLVTPAPIAWHQEVIQRLARLIEGYLDTYPAGHLFVSPADISWGPDILVQPDLFVVRMDQAKTMDWSEMKGLLLAVEVWQPDHLFPDVAIASVEWRPVEAGEMLNIRLEELFRPL